MTLNLCGICSGPPPVCFPGRPVEAPIFAIATINVPPDWVAAGGGVVVGAGAAGAGAAGAGAAVAGAGAGATGAAAGALLQAIAAMNANAITTPKTRLCGHFAFVSCHSERSEESEVCEWRLCNEFRFFTPLRSVQNDKINLLFMSKTLYVSNVNRT